MPGLSEFSRVGKLFLGSRDNRRINPEYDMRAVIGSMLVEADILPIGELVLYRSIVMGQATA
ncbi:hypothetical protein N7488_003605 [Penicillium malachiteum]|nr:hypothetical protein N7488_003605 [Penicillium malachiteum]